MKRLLLTLFVLTVLPVSATYAQDSTSIGFAGVRVVDSTQMVSFGISQKIANGPLRLLIYTDVGQYGSVSTELSAWKNIGSLQVGLLAGPGANFDGTDVAYLSGTAGIVVATKQIKGLGLGLWGAMKYEFTDGVQSGYQWGAGLHTGIGQ